MASRIAKGFFFFLIIIMYQPHIIFYVDNISFFV